MVTLQELVNDQPWTDMSDIQVIKTFFELNDIEEEGVDLIHELTKSKIEKLKSKQRMAKEWICCLPSDYLYETYDLNTATQLHILELNYLVNGGELSERYLKWARDNVPNIVRPQAYFNPLVDWMRDNGIEFRAKEV